jgi:unspecific peroxygenase
MIYGNGYFNRTVAGELRYHRIQQSIANNPAFEMLGFRHTTAYAEASFPATFFVDGRVTGAMAGHLDMATAERFFKGMQFPKDFHRPAAPVSGSTIEAIYAAHPTEPGRNVNGTNTFEVDYSIGSLTDTCAFYTGFVMTKVAALYPNPAGVLRRNLKRNLELFYDTVAGNDCVQVFPYGRD